MKFYKNIGIVRCALWALPLLTAACSHQAGQNGNDNGVESPLSTGGTEGGSSGSTTSGGSTTAKLVSCEKLFDVDPGGPNKPVPADASAANIEPNAPSPPASSGGVITGKAPIQPSAGRLLCQVPLALLPETGKGAPGSVPPAPPVSSGGSVPAAPPASGGGSVPPTPVSSDTGKGNVVLPLAPGQSSLPATIPLVCNILVRPLNAANPASTSKVVNSGDATAESGLVVGTGPAGEVVLQCQLPWFDPDSWGDGGSITIVSGNSGSGSAGSETPPSGADGSGSVGSSPPPPTTTDLTLFCTTSLVVPGAGVAAPNKGVASDTETVPPGAGHLELLCEASAQATPVSNGAASASTGSVGKNLLAGVTCEINGA